MPIETTQEASRPRPNRRILFRIGAVFFSLLLACAFGEAALRIVGYSRSYINPGGSFHEPHPLVGCRGKPNFVGRFRQKDFDVTIAHDELGFRRQEKYPGLPEPKHDVYVLGDSFVWGYGVGQDDIFTNRLSKLMPGWRIHNLGLAGSGTVEQYTLFKAYAYEHLRPGDQVVLAFFGNDFGDNIGRFQDRIHAKIEDGRIVEVRPPTPSQTAAVKNRLKDVSCLFNLITFCIDRYRASGPTMQNNLRATRKTPTDAEIREATTDASDQVIITKHYLAEFQSACREKKVDLLVAYVPGQAELGEDDVTSTEDLTEPEQKPYRDAFVRCTRSLGIKTLDLLPYLAAAKQKGRFDRITFTHDFHWCRNGHAVAAETISAALTNPESLAKRNAEWK